MRRVIDHDGGEFTIVEAVRGLAVALWLGDDGQPEATALAWVHADGTVMLPQRSRGAAGGHVEHGRAVGRWVEASSGEPAVIEGGVPVLPPRSSVRATAGLGRTA